MKKILFLILLISKIFVPDQIQAQDRNIQVNEVYPPSMFKENGGKFINVKNLVAAGIYHKNAVGDGVADDSDAIIAAMTWVQNRLKAHYVNVQPVQVHWHELWTIYLPNGTYRVTKPLVYGGGRVPDPLRLDHADREGSQKILLVGQSRENTIIKLDNNASGFQSGGYKAVVAFSRFDLSPPTIFNNMPSGNQIRNITIDTGTGNLNAIGLDFCGANTSRLDNIKVKGSGRIGIHMRTGTTAGYQSNVTVEGFDYGIYMEGYSVNHSVFEYVTLVNQNISAVYLTIASASIRKLRSTNSVTGVLIEKTSSLTPHLVITDSEFTGGGSSARVFNINDGHLFARNINVGGYGITVSKNGTTVNSGSIQEYASDNITTYSNDRVRSSAIKSMNLPVEEYPIVPWESNHSNWANVHDYGAIGDGTTDDMAAIQTAMNSGKPVVYFPKMRYNTSGKITIPSTVKQIIGSNVQILGSGDKFEISQASSSVLLFHYINLRSGGVVRHTAQRDILLESTHSHGNVYVSDLTQKGSKLFVNNGLGFVRNSGVLKNIDVWVRWNNNEKHAHYQFNVGPGCNFWMMGFKSEGTYSVFDVQGGSLLEVLGGVMSRFGQIPPDAPAVGIRNSNSHISIIANTQGPNRNWAPMIQDIQGGTTKSWQMNAFPIRNSEQNIVIPLYASYNPALIPNPITDTQAPTVPAGLASSSITQTSFILSWTASSDNVGVTGYEVFAGGVSKGTTTSTSLSVTGLTCNAAHSVTVKARDAAGNWSAASAALNVTTSACSTCSNEQGLTTTHKTNTPVSIDGSLSEASWCISNTLNKCVIGSCNNSVTFGTLWNNTHLFVGVKVLDSNLLHNSTNNWNGDAIEIYLDANHNGGTSYDIYDRQYVIKFNGGTLLEKNGHTTGVLHAAGVVAGGYTIELAIPWSNLGITPSENLILGFDISNDDDDSGSGRQHQGMWNGTADNWRYPSGFGDIKLSIPADPGTTDTQSPTAPTGLTSSSIGQTSFTLSWSASADNVGVTGYEVFAGGVSKGTTTTTSMSITGLTCNTAYSMTVKARDAAGNWSAGSTALNITTSACSDTQAPTVPTNLVSSNITQTSFILSWTASTDNVGVTGYEVFAGGVSKGTTTTTSMSITGLTCNTAYSMTVKARDAAGNWSAGSTALSVTTTSCSTTDPALKVWWKFDETSGTTASDASGNSKNGSLLNGLQFSGVAGKFGNALAFDGTDDVVRYNQAPGVSAYPFSISAWVKTSSTSNQTVAFLGDGTAGDRYYTIGMNNGKAFASARNTTAYAANGSSVISNGAWHLIVGVFESATSRRLYVDGVQAATNTNSVSIVSSINRFSSGLLDRSSIADKFNGSIDDVRLYGKALTAVEVSGMFSALQSAKLASINNRTDESVNSTSQIFNIQMYPNPLKDGNLTIVTNLDREKHLINIYSIDGKILHSNEFSGKSTKISSEIFKPGVYIISVKSDSQIQRLILVKE